MNSETPEHHIHHTLENIKREAEANPSAPATNGMLHKVAFRESKIADQNSKAVQQSIKFAKWAWIAAMISALFALLDLLCRFIGTR